VKFVEDICNTGTHTLHEIDTMAKFTEDDLKKGQKEPRDELGVKVLNTFYDMD
jgi:hypothetical protein